MAVTHQIASAFSQPTEGFRLRVEWFIRLLPIRWRIQTIVAMNTIVLIVLAALIWDGARVINSAWDDLRNVRRSDQLLVLLEGEAVRLQNLIHRYIREPSSDVFAEILLHREALLNTLRSRGTSDPNLSGSVEDLIQATERFLAGFSDLRAVQSAITRIYENELLKPARDMAGLYGIIEGATGRRDALIWPSLGKSREAFTTALVSANVYYLSLSSDAADEARTRLAMIEQTIPVMLDLADNDLQRNALNVLRERAASFRQGLARLAANFSTRTELLRDAVDSNQASMGVAIQELFKRTRFTEQHAQARFDRALANVYRNATTVALISFLIIAIHGAVIGHSIIRPLQELREAMLAIVAGRYNWRLHGTRAHDEIGEMQSAVEVFRENAIAKARVENELRAAKDHAEHALTELQNAQRSLIEAEKLAALGGLVAGVAHEVNNPVGIGLTVASTFARRCEQFAREVREGPLRRSRLDEFIESCQDAARQLVVNLERAGELIQSFKQVAVDRSHAERRDFDLRQSTEQVVVSLRPGLKNLPISLAVEVPDGIAMDSYPGPYGQVLTNLVLNAVAHAFPDGRAGSITIRASRLDADHVEITFADDGVGMSEEVQRRAFDPFFTTRRSQGGTGLGLHIVYNIVTHRLGGRITFVSDSHKGTTFRMTLPLHAPSEN